MCNNSIMGGHINFILGSYHENDPNNCGTKMDAMETSVA